MDQVKKPWDMKRKKMVPLHSGEWEWRRRWHRWGFQRFQRSQRKPDLKITFWEDTLQWKWFLREQTYFCFCYGGTALFQQFIILFHPLRIIFLPQWSLTIFAKSSPWTVRTDMIWVFFHCFKGLGNSHFTEVSVLSHIFLKFCCTSC